METKKFTEAEAQAIMIETRANVAGARADMQRWRAERQQRDANNRFVVKTTDNARVPLPESPAPAPEPVPQQIPEYWPAQTIFDVVGEAVGLLLKKQGESFQKALEKRDAAIQTLRDEVEIKIGLSRKLARLKVQIAEARQMQPNFGQALDKRDREIENLWREIKLLRDEVGLERGLSKLKSEVAAAREMQPNFESELDGLRKEIAKHEKTISRLRGQISQLEFVQKQLETEQTKNRQQVTLTAVQLTAFGEQTREVLQRLREAGVDFIEEWSPSGPAS
jgi:predicted RNase H-like nuclease (RuvC/YqgF family)